MSLRGDDTEISSFREVLDVDNVIQHEEIFPINSSTESFNVIFKDWNGDVIDIREVELGGSAIPPEDPTREGYLFVGWDVPFDNITQETIVTAQYKQEIGGTVSITGRLKFGEELTADISDITPPGADISYQWNKNGIEIDGATNSTYAVTKADIGENITVTITGTGDYIGSITSDAVTPTKADGAKAPDTPTLFSKTATTVILDEQEGYEYRVADGEWQASGEFTDLDPSTTYKFYQRVAETQTHKASGSSESIEVTTCAYFLGDINDDGRITTVDALMALQVASGRIELTDSQKLAADVNKDGRVTTVDALMILQYASGRIDSFG